MMPSSPLTCAACGAAIQPQAVLCIVCGQLLAACTEDPVLASPVLAEPLVPPALLAGRYRVVGMVGKGGFGAVYKAEDVQRDGLFVAIKEINLGGLSPQEVIEATDTFNREVRLLSGLAHPNLPHIYEHFTDAEHWYLVMDFIEGETLEEYLESTKGGHPPVAEVLDIGLQLCTALHYLHTRQPPIIFRDVKPANVMRTAMGHLYLIDFGIARHFTPGQSRDTNALGSPGYAAPEQYGKAQTTVQSDIYSLGATLQTLLTGKDPLDPISGSLYAEDVPEELELLLVRMLDTDTQKRPASMGSVKWTLQWIKDRSLLKVPATQQPAPNSGYTVATSASRARLRETSQQQPARSSGYAVATPWAAIISLWLSGIGILMLILAFTTGPSIANACYPQNSGYPDAMFIVLPLIYLPSLLASIFGFIAKPSSASGSIVGVARALGTGLFLFSIALFPILFVALFFTDAPARCYF